MGDDALYNPLQIASLLNMDKFKVMEVLSLLCDKGIISIEIRKNESGKSEEYISLDMLYNKLVGSVVDLENKVLEEDDSIYGVFEQEFGRSLSPMEYEIIKGWMNSNISQEMIKEALKEAIYNGVNNLRYIDKILYEWNKKNIKTKGDIIKDREHYRNKKKENVEVFDYDWLDE